MKPSTYYEFRLYIEQTESNQFGYCRDEDEEYTDPAVPRIRIDSRETTENSMRVTCSAETGSRSYEGTEIEHQKMFMRRGVRNDGGDYDTRDPLENDYRTYSNYLVGNLAKNTCYCFRCDTRIDEDRLEDDCSVRNVVISRKKRPTKVAIFEEECGCTTPPVCVEDFRVVYETGSRIDSDTREQESLEVEWTQEANLEYQLQMRIYDSGRDFVKVFDGFRSYDRTALEKVEEFN